MAFLSSISNILLIILGFGVLIFVHELGHFLAAKWANIRTEAFAVGMGPVALAWRKGIGLRFGSTAAETERRIEDYLKREADVSIQFKEKTTEIKISPEQRNRAEVALGLGETEYSLRWLPVGGFVKMLGQEDANPNYVSNDPRSYTMCPVGKRMIVVSAGVIMNLLLAVVFFVIAFTGGVQFEAPVVGDVISGMQAATVRADNADALGITKDGLQPGDVVVQTNDDDVHTFADLQIASAMSKPNVPVRLEVRREGVAEPLRFSIMPQKDPTTGLLSFGIVPGSSNTLKKIDEGGELARVLQETGLSDAGVRPGMRMVSVNNQAISTYQQFEQHVEQSNGQPAKTQWVPLNERAEPKGPAINVDLPAQPTFAVQRYPDAGNDPLPNYEFGLFGMVPLVKIDYVLPTSRNKGVLNEGDVILKIEGTEAPRLRDFYEIVQKHEPGTLNMLVLRDGREVHVTALVDRKGMFKSNGMLNVLPAQAWELPLMATPMERVGVVDEKSDGNGSSKPQVLEKSTPVAALRLLGRDRIAEVGGTAVTDWTDIRGKLRDQTEQALAKHEAANIELTIVHPTPGNPSEKVQLALSADDVASLHGLTWHSNLGPGAFEPIYTTLTSGGNPIRAISMGFHETYKTVILTYLTIDRLFRGSVGISQLRGPVGIVHIGAKVADRGFLYILFFLGMISVNLAVINFLPMPIVDGGLFLFLIYEKFKGRPPPLAFQNAATIVGICMIGALFLITFYNDVMRLLS